jgi:hypothetical protein
MSDGGSPAALGWARLLAQLLWMHIFSGTHNFAQTTTATQSPVECHGLDGCVLAAAAAFWCSFGVDVLAPTPPLHSAPTQTPHLTDTAITFDAPCQTGYCNMDP